jgi:hypothetical protein
MKPIILESLDRYVNYGILPGHFLTAVLENNLAESLGRADADNRENLFEIVSYIYNEIPAICWGNPEAVREWIGHSGRKGVIK